MPSLYLIRHAKSSWKQPELEDSKRPLSNRGERDAPEMARRLKLQSIIPDLIISSPALRARKTAEIISSEMGYDESEIKYDWELFHASTNTLLSILKKIPPRFRIVFLFGHNPGLTYFANSLSNLKIDNIPTTGIVGIEFNKPWKDINFGTGKMLLYDYPKKVKE